jgi:hypothetical protein
MANKYQPKTNCFAYGCNECAVLTDLYCAKEGKCRFYKTQEQHKEDQFKARMRLKAIAGLKK